MLPLTRQQREEYEAQFRDYPPTKPKMSLLTFMSYILTYTIGFMFLTILFGVIASGGTGTALLLYFFLIKK